MPSLLCFSPQADVIGGIVVFAIGLDAARNIKGRNDRLLLAALPLLLGFHQLNETFVWLSLQGHVSHAVGRAAIWIYLLIAFVVLPVFVPSAILAAEPDRRRKERMIPFIVLGFGVSTTLLVTMLRNPVTAQLHSHHIGYHIQLHHGLAVVGAYVIAICGATLVSGYRHVVLFGLANIVVVAILAKLTIDGFASLWCGYAALTAGAIAFHMRYAKPHRAAPYVLT
jgi:hypothetical protein